MGLRVVELTAQKENSSGSLGSLLWGARLIGIFCGWIAAIRGLWAQGDVLYPFSTMLLPLWGFCHSETSPNFQTVTWRLQRKQSLAAILAGTGGKFGSHRAGPSLLASELDGALPLEPELLIPFANLGPLQGWLMC